MVREDGGAVVCLYLWFPDQNPVDRGTHLSINLQIK